ncbi:MAG: hypothetical protein HYU03_03820 [Thaumarchaeota archaeon]|nr:hypothetical protein [Nitrososphaerota archaeon]MCS4539802.1 hypothetical protein [Nitrososphaerota archaeon]
MVRIKKSPNVGNAKNHAEAGDCPEETNSERGEKNLTESRKYADLAEHAAIKILRGPQTHI